MFDSGTWKYLDNLIYFIVILLLITIPLAIWKIIDITIWLIQHIKISLG